DDAAVAEHDHVLDPDQRRYLRAAVPGETAVGAAVGVEAQDDATAGFVECRTEQAPAIGLHRRRTGRIGVVRAEHQAGGPEAGYGHAHAVQPQAGGGELVATGVDIAAEQEATIRAARQGQPDIGAVEAAFEPA